MKKIFCIISAVFIGLIGSFLTTLACVRIQCVKFENPYSINIYYKSTTTANDGKSYYDDDAGYYEIMENLKKTVKNPLLRVMISDGDIRNKPFYGGDNYVKYDTSLKSNNLVVELIYKETQNIICYEGENTRVMSFTCMIIIIPCNSFYEEMIVYTSVNNDSTLKEEEYKKCKPFVIKGNPKPLLKYAEQFSPSK